MPPSHYAAIRDLMDAFDRRALAAHRAGERDAQAKADGTTVTALDRETSRHLLAELKARFPDYGIVCEEEGEPHAPGAKQQWVIDPLDGTAMFARGFPVWGLGIGLMEGDTPLEGYLGFPVIGERYACAGDEITLNDRSIDLEHPSALPDTRNLLVGSTLWQELPLGNVKGYKMRNFGTNLYHLLAVALGRAEATISPRCYPWDIIPAWPFVRAAHLEARYADGAPFDMGRLWRPENRRGALPAPLIVGRAEVVAELVDRFK